MGRFDLDVTAAERAEAVLMILLRHVRSAGPVRPGRVANVRRSVAALDDDRLHREYIAGRHLLSGGFRMAAGPKHELSMVVHQMITEANHRRAQRRAGRGS